MAVALNQEQLTQVLTALSDLVKNIKDELLSFSLILTVAVLLFPLYRWWIFFIWLAAICAYVFLKFHQSRTERDDIMQAFRLQLRKKNQWQRRVLRGATVWVFRPNPLFQIEEGEVVVEDFSEPWLQKYPDMEHNFSYYVYLKYQNTIVDQLLFVCLDGRHYTVPAPEAEEKVPLQSE